MNQQQRSLTCGCILGSCYVRDWESFLYPCLNHATDLEHLAAMLFLLSESVAVDAQLRSAAVSEIERLSVE